MDGGGEGGLVWFISVYFLLVFILFTSLFVV